VHHESAALQLAAVDASPRLKLAAGSPITMLKVKLQARYVDQDRTTTLGWNDLRSDKGDAAKTFEVEHSYAAVTLGTTNDLSPFFLDARRMCLAG
jgi:hypothetical protein